jgi:phosphoribosylformylglycinamidine synthase subunit PurQ / glutaminase
MARAFALVGAQPEVVHVDALIEHPERLDEADLVGFPGGFSYGDDIASGRIFAMKVREKLWPALRRALERGTPMIGACNGFQIMVQIGLLPGPTPSQGWSSDAPPPQTLALTDNIKGYQDRWVGIEPVANSVCVWTQGLEELAASVASACGGTGVESWREAVLQLPVAHGEGRLVAASESHAQRLFDTGQVALTYRDNYNGSQRGIAGVCDPSGLVLGLMPHPERFLDWTRHPSWTRLPPEARAGETLGLWIFKNAARAVSARAPVELPGRSATAQV